MRKLFILAIMTLLSMSTMAQNVQQLPTPKFDKKSNGVSLVETLQRRESVREYSAEAITDQELSNILWAACGINRPDSKRLTSPTAMNAQDIIVYVCRADGAWRYDALQNSLTRITELDLRKAIGGRQEFAVNAPVCLLLVSDISKLRGNREFGAMDAGYVSENIYLVCAAMGLKTVARAMMERDALMRELGLNDSQIPMLNHPIGK